jgi:hypothetical protein
MLGAELSPSDEGNHVSYAEEGKAYFYGQLKLLWELVDSPRAGAAVHHIATWYDLKD